MAFLVSGARTDGARGKVRLQQSAVSKDRVMLFGARSALPLGHFAPFADGSEASETGAVGFWLWCVCRCVAAFGAAFARDAWGW